MIGEDRQTGGASRLISLREYCGIEIDSDHTSGWACLLNLTDQSICSCLATGEQGSAEATRRTGFACPRLDQRFGTLAFGEGDLLALVDGDIFENAHAASLCVAARSCSSFASAAPSRSAP